MAELLINKWNGESPRLTVLAFLQIRKLNNLPNTMLIISYKKNKKTNNIQQLSEKWMPRWCNRHCQPEFRRNRTILSYCDHRYHTNRGWMIHQVQLRKHPHIANVVILPMLQLFSNPDYINQMVMWMCKKFSLTSEFISDLPALHGEGWRVGSDHKEMLNREITLLVTCATFWYALICPIHVRHFFFFGRDHMI